MTYRFAPARPPAVATEAMVATSHPLATRAGLRMLERGGNAVDAVLAAAAALCVAEPMWTGIGGDAFALVWRDGEAVGLDGAGPAPAGATALEPVEAYGPRSVTVPGAVAGWAAIAERFGSVGLDACLSDAIDAAERGVAVARRTAASWAREGSPEGFPPPPAVGARVRLPHLAATLRDIAEHGPRSFYEGSVAAAIAGATWLDEDDLAAYAPRWVDPMSILYRGHEVLELPPPTQGVAALEALGLLDLAEPTLLEQVRAAELALDDAFRNVRDGADVSALLDPAFLERRRGEGASPVPGPGGGTVYLCAVDSAGMAVSFVQSLFEAFGSRVVAPGTGVVLQNRGACFSVSGRVVPGTRPYHTIIAGLLLRDGKLGGPFGVTGGFIQAQAHLQLVSALVDGGLDPQAALDRPRFRVEGEALLLEDGLWDEAPALEAAGYTVVREDGVAPFGSGQAILVEGDALVGGSDSRRDGYAAGV